MTQRQITIYDWSTNNETPVTPAEQEALANKAAGKPYDQAAYNSAKQKLKQGGKFAGDVNRQKRKGNNRSQFSDQGSALSGLHGVFEDLLVGTLVVVAIIAVVTIIIISLPVAVLL